MPFVKKNSSAIFTLILWSSKLHTVTLIFMHVFNIIILFKQSPLDGSLQLYLFARKYVSCLIRGRMVSPTRVSSMNGS